MLYPFVFADTVSLFPTPANSIFLLQAPSFYPSVNQFVAGRFADPPVAFSHFQFYTYHSSNSLSQPLKPSLFHN